ncbi:hypothetical protein FHR81_003253 [Actinoalloteichus hoggarensis]|uniref:VWA domain containing CoxE-like protein n=1 Tax=Actinoalloteichus hoggarensis TaxID=1470176 RepID=A0A221W7V7_9PSEU|nr:VWA domain-containing protein [Actinoalloteichus hoggarensis]ASO21609.1 VWA domain containing CoxE-like protein [Actinoalloteichus hoggarensis]MBB5922201.1 hypothetical protein [Actinoalloteichus hoggarensis]
MTTHLISDPAAPGTAVFPAAPGWLTLSAAMTEEVPLIADRDDLLVTIAPGAGHGAPACFLPNQSLIELDGTHLGAVDPATATPHLNRDRARYATAWGLLTHECAHAAHSRWDPPSDAPPNAAGAATLLEESRIEAAHLRRRPDDRHWLRASSINLILADLPAADPAHGPAMTAHDAAQAAALVLARTDAGVLTATETAPVAQAVEAVLGEEAFAALRTVWREAFTVADDDAEAMLDLGRRWCEIIGTPPEPEPDTDPDSEPDPGPGPGTEPDGVDSGSAPDPAGASVPSPLTRAITTSLVSVARSMADEAGPTDPEPAADATATPTADPAADAHAATVARRVFATDGPGSGRTATMGTRSPTAAERTAARTMARALTTAGVRERVATKTTSAMPPGRLRMRGALAADAQRAAGALPTAEPFTRTTRTTVPAPPLRLGIACDVSGSMSKFAGPVASTAWILAHAARHTSVPADTATVIFGYHVRPIVYPGTAPARVTEFDAADDWEAVDEAVDALDGALRLSLPGAARLLVVISDGHFPDEPRAAGQHRVNRLRATGCGVLWLSPHKRSIPFDGVTVHTLTDPSATARAVGRAATAALRAAR